VAGKVERPMPWREVVKCSIAGGLMFAALFYLAMILK
jgi:hypothetical protein